MSEQSWHAQWSQDLERAWKERLTPAADNPRMSIRADAGHRATVAAPQPGGAANRTRQLSETENEEVRSKRPTVTPRREIHVAAPGIEGQLGRTEFELETELGAGGMGRVFRAKQISLGREVAVKQLQPTEEIPDATEVFESEACVTAILEHPNIVPVYDMGVDQAEQIFYSMKLVDGTPWDDLLAMRRPGHADAGPGERHDLRGHIEILLETANAVAYAHSRGIIHRDIKPQNVMVGDYGEVLLVDWGLACALAPDPKRPARILDINQVLVTCGTPVYMPPEISTGQREWVGPWTDVFMLGAVLFEVLYGIPPHEEATAIDALRIASKNEWSFPESVPPEIEPFHDVLRPVIERALSTHPHARQHDGKAFRDDLQAALRHLDSAELASEAVQDFRQIEGIQARAQHERLSGKQRKHSDQQQTYRTLGRVVAVLEQALEWWPENAVAQHYIVEAHLLHAFCALANEETSMVRQQLDLLGHLPEGVMPSPEQSARTASIKRRLDEILATRERKKRLTRLLQVSAIALALIVLVGSTVAALLVRGARDQARLERNHLSKLLIGTAADGLEAELEGLLQPVRGSLLGAADWAEAGRLDTDDPLALTSFFLPLIDGYPVISSVLRADTLGNEYMLLRQGDDGWRVRVSSPGLPAVFQTLDASGKVLETWTETIDYDPRTRPWFEAATTTRDTIVWTEPYTFFTTKQPGVTAARTAKSSGGREFVLGIDMLLTDLSEFTMRMPHTDHGDQHGMVFVLDAQRRVIGLPRSPKFVDDAAKLNAVLQPLDEIGEPVSAEALRSWDTGGMQSEPFRIEAAGQAWWAGFRSFELDAAHPLWIGVVLPEADFPDLVAP
ncbi:MAG: protein kinase domain-containing protein [Nannocystaceae bacterium]|nr:protein kinase [bacterium]